MADPREEIEVAIETALAGITAANGYAVPRDIQRVTRRGEVITNIPDDDRPLLLLLTQVDKSEYIELSLLKETLLTVNVKVYETIYEGEEPTTLLNTYAAAIRRCLSLNRYWGGLAEFTTIDGVTQHQVLEELLPSVMTTVAATVTYDHYDEDA